MKLLEKIAARGQARPFYTFEFFPPRTDQGTDNLLLRISRLSLLDPLAISITWGAGGSTKERSLELAGLTQEEYGIDTILHLTCTNMERGSIDDLLRAAKSRGIQNVLALRGDPPRGQEYWVAADPRFVHGIDLVTYIRSSPEFSSAFCIGVAAYPDGHPDREEDEEQELIHLKAKIDAGADFIVTQLFYDVDRFVAWQEKVRRIGITVPIIPGIMPLQTYSSFLRLTKLCGTHIPESLATALEAIRHDDQLVKDYGVTLAVQMIGRLTAEAKVPGVHFCTLNLEKSVQRVLEQLQWVGKHPEIHNKLISDTADDIVHAPPAESEHVITASGATNSFTHGLVAVPAVDGDAGRGEVNNAATWDEFPNGRFGDYKSPAFGDQDQWGGSRLSRNEALSRWGHPKSIVDLTNLFVGYLRGKLPTTPFSPAPLSPESLTILEHLERLTRCGLWTVGSQPAVDGAPSTDEVVGWGPRGGYVFQKGFVEFFAEEEDVKAVEKKVAESGGWVDYLAANVEGDCRGSVSAESRNAVTWGVFPGQEITQSTIIETESFLSWKDEAFSMWKDWASFYPPQSPEREVLEGVWKRRWLVSVVHHDFKGLDALWEFLFSEGGLGTAPAS